MPLITRTLKGSKLSIEEMDGNLNYLENLALSNLRDYVQLANKPLIIDNNDRWNAFKDLKLDNNHLYIDGPYSLRFTNHVNEGGPNYLMRAWDWDGPSRFAPTVYQNEEVVYNERAQILYNLESIHKSSISLKSFDWTAGSQSGLQFEYKFYQGSLILPINNTQPTTTDGTIAFSDGVNWDPDDSNSPALNIRIGGAWKQINLGPGVQGATGPIGSTGPTGPGFTITNPSQNKVLLSDGSPQGAIADSRLSFSGPTLSITGDLKISGVLQSSTFQNPSLSSASLTGNTTLQNINTILNDEVLVVNSIMDFDYVTGSIFYVFGPNNNFTMNLINLPITNKRAINVTLFVQNTGPFICTSVQIGGVVQDLKWAGGQQPVPVSSGISVYTFNILRSSDTWIAVLGSYGIYF